MAAGYPQRDCGFGDPTVGLVPRADQRGTRPRRNATFDRTTRLEHDLERNDHAANDEPGKDSQHDRSAWQSCQPRGQTRPQRERERLREDHDPDRIFQRDGRQTKDREQGNRRNREEKKS